MKLVTFPPSTLITWHAGTSIRLPDGGIVPVGVCSAPLWTPFHTTSMIGRHKLDSAEHAINEVNPNVEVVKHPTFLTSENALDIIEPYDLVIDGTDNFPTRYLVNDACVLLGKPNVYGSIFRF